MSKFRSIVYATLAGLSATTALQSATAQESPPKAFTMDTSAGTPAAATPMPGALATLPATVEQLTFAGEGARRQFAVYVLPLETTKPARLVLSYQSAVSIMPEASLMSVFVNDIPVGETRLGVGGGDTLSLDLKPGTLQPGFNQVRILVDQHHRVDCSISGTYELWTSIDPARSGLSFEGGTAPIEGLADIPALSRLDVDGITSIHATLPAGHSAKDVERAMSAVQSAVLIGEFANPRVSFGDAAAGTALEIVTATFANLENADPTLLTGNTPVPAVTFQPATPTSAARLVVVGATSDELDRNLAALQTNARGHKPAGTSAGLRSLVNAKGLRLSQGEQASLADLGMSSRQFAGRFYEDQASFRLPADFYPADYDDAELTLNARYASGLARDSQLIVRANGRVVSTIPLGSSQAGLIEGQKLRVPLGALQPGKNTLTFEANLPNESDGVCDPAVQANPPARLLVSETSSLSIPNFARVGHVPDLSAMASGGSGVAGGGSELSILTKTLETSRIDVAATFVSKMAASAQTTFDTRFLTTMPHEATGNLIAFGTYNDLPMDLLEAVRLASSSQTVGAAPRDGFVVGAAEAGGMDWTSALAGAGSGETVAKPARDEATSTPVGFQSFITAFSQPADPVERIKALGLDVSDAFFEAAGFEQSPFADKVDPSTFHRPPSDASLVIAQGKAPESSGAAWTVVASETAGALASEVALLTSSERWNQVTGSFVSLRGDAKTVHAVTTGDEHLFETQPRTISNARLIVAGWFSRHLESYVIALLLACLMLGLTTFLFLRSVGEQKR